MTKIEELLAPDEQIIKKQSGVTLSKGSRGIPSGSLYLTNTRLIFLFSKGWSILSPTPGAGWMGKDIVLSLQDIKSVNKGHASLKVDADKAYEFTVSMWHAGSWADAVQQAIALYPPRQVPPYPQPQQPVSSPQQTAPQPSGRKFCPNCGAPVKPEARFCEGCGTKLQ